MFSSFGRRCWFGVAALALLLSAAPRGVAAASTASPHDFAAGVARIRVTPPLPYWLSGYAARTRPADSVLQDIWAKALALRDPQGYQVVIVTIDVIGLPARVSQEVGRRVLSRHGLAREQVLLNCSHTHSGPMLRENLSVMYALDPAEDERIRAYSEELTDRLVTVIGEAIAAQQPARLESGQGEVAFAVNRRTPTPTGFKIGVNPKGPTDHSVPVVRVTSLDGTLRAVLFAYACHNTTLGATTYQINGDYAGFAQAEVEQAHPGVTALFMELCGGDQNPNPRGTVELVQQHGRALGREVSRVLQTSLQPVRPPLRAAFATISLTFSPHTREGFAEEANHTDKFRQRRARLMLAAYDRGAAPKAVAYPVQAVRFGTDLTLLALGGEVVLDYALRAKRDYPGANLIVAGYSNEVMCYIPSRRVLQEGGYEAVDSMIYYGQPGPFTPAVEDEVFAGIDRVLGQVGVRASARAP